MSATSIAGGFLVFLYEKNWLEAIMKMNKMLALASVFCYDKRVFRAG
ncbi:hypothetical protein U753_06090 [Streptococcus pseudopneumoniae 5247]|nr:hypothetical protein U753_06090 [Streptococcus pseudopneumoniae 5247]